MTYYDYKVSQEIAAIDYPFNALIMAAMRKADSLNIVLLRDAFPLTWKELDARYNRPGGVFAHENLPTFGGLHG